MPVIRPSLVSEKDTLLDLWERSVRATHHFLSEGDVLSYRPLVKEALASDLELWTVRGDTENEPLGFMGLGADALGALWKLEALFIDPRFLRKGLGTLLVTHARLVKGPLILDVNEQNPNARAFYSRFGFVETGRSPIDGAGLPFPLLHMFG